jgi:hypothetical protein
MGLPFEQKKEGQQQPWGAAGLVEKGNCGFVQ